MDDMGLYGLYTLLYKVWSDVRFLSPKPKYRIWILSFQSVSTLCRVYFRPFRINFTLLELRKRSNSHVSMTQAKDKEFMFWVVSEVPRAVLSFEISVTGSIWPKISIPDRENSHTRCFSDSDFRVKSSFFLKSILCSSDTEKRHPKSWTEL